MAPGLSCSKSGCPGQGTWIPVLVIGKDGSRDTVHGALPELGHCESHRTEARLADFLSPEGWAKLAAHLTAAGKGRFSKQATSLTWRRSSAPELLPF